MTLAQLIARARETLNARINTRNAHAATLTELRSAETPDAAAIATTRAAITATDAEISELRANYDSLLEEQRQDEAVARLQSEITPVATPTSRSPEATRTTSDVTVREGRTYTRENDPQGELFLRDVVSDFLGARGPHRERLERHELEERTERGEARATRGVTTGGAPGLVVPQYLTDMYAAKGRPGRKFADQCRTHPLPATGMEVYIPRQIAKTSVADQTTELTPVAESDYSDEDISVKVRTAAGSQTISRQSSERSLGTLDVVFEDLLKSYDVNLDSQLLNSPVWGLLAVANAITYTDADPTAAEVYRKILAAGANVEDVLLDLDEDDLFTVMRGRRWKWLQGEMSDKWPFISRQGLPALAGGNSDGSPYSAGIRGQLPDGGDVVTDNNLPNGLGTGTNEDVLAVVARQEAHLWEDASAPLLIRAEQAKSLGIDLVVYGYYAACFNRVVDAQGTPKAVHQKITGTGLVAPVF